MDFLTEGKNNAIMATFNAFVPHIRTNPRAVLDDVEGQLASLYIRYGNDWTGRGVVGDTLQDATIAALEAVRAECLEQLTEEMKN